MNHTILFSLLHTSGTKTIRFSLSKIPYFTVSKNLMYSAAAVLILLTIPVHALYFSFTKTHFSISAQLQEPFSTEYSPNRQIYYVHKNENYFALNQVTGYIAVPVIWGFEYTKFDPNENQSSLRQLWFGDMHIVLGKKYSLFEPKIGASIPLGYSYDKPDSAFVGFNSILGIAGIEINKSSAIILQTFTFTGDMSLYIAMTDKNSLCAPGSWQLKSILNMGYAFDSLVSVAISLDTWISIIKWTKPKLNTESKELELGLLPSVACTFFSSPQFHYTISLSGGPEFNQIIDKTILYYSSNQFKITLGCAYTP